MAAMLSPPFENQTIQQPDNFGPFESRHVLCSDPNCVPVSYRASIKNLTTGIESVKIVTLIIEQVQKASLFSTDGLFLAYI